MRNKVLKGATKMKNREIGASNKWKFTEDTVKKLEEVFLMDGTVEEACFFANITTVTYYNWVKQNPDLKERFNALRLHPILKARRGVVNGLTNYQNSMDYLKRKRKDEFGDNVIPQGINVFIKLEKEEKEKIDKSIDAILNNGIYETEGANLENIER